MKPFWRWVLVLPAAVGAYLAAVLIQNLSMFLYGQTWLITNFREWFDILCRTVGIYFYVIAGTAVAPKGKFPTAITLSILVWALSIFVLSAYLLLRIQSQVASLIEVPFLCGAAVIACIQVYKEEKKKR